MAVYRSGISHDLWGKPNIFFKKILFTGRQQEGIKIKVMDILNIPAVVVAFLFSIANRFFCPI